MMSRLVFAQSQQLPLLLAIVAALCLLRTADAQLTECQQLTDSLFSNCSTFSTESNKNDTLPIGECCRLAKIAHDAGCFCDKSTYSGPAAGGVKALAVAASLHLSCGVPTGDLHVLNNTSCGDPNVAPAPPPYVGGLPIDDTMCLHYSLVLYKNCTLPAIHPPPGETLGIRNERCCVYVKGANDALCYCRPVPKELQGSGFTPDSILNIIHLICYVPLNQSNVFNKTGCDSSRRVDFLDGPDSSRRNTTSPAPSRKGVLSAILLVAIAILTAFSLL